MLCICLYSSANLSTVLNLWFILSILPVFKKTKQNKNCIIISSLLCCLCKHGMRSHGKFFYHLFSKVLRCKNLDNLDNSPESVVLIIPDLQGSSSLLKAFLFFSLKLAWLVIFHYVLYFHKYFIKSLNMKQMFHKFF